MSFGVGVGIGGQDRCVAAFRRRGRHGHEFVGAERRGVIRGRVGVELRSQVERCGAVRDSQRGELRRGQRLAAIHPVPALRRQRGRAKVGVALADAGPDGRAVEREGVGPDADSVAVEVAGLNLVFERQCPASGLARVAEARGGGSDVHLEAGRAAVRVHVHVPVELHRDGDGLAARVGVGGVQGLRGDRDARDARPRLRHRQRVGPVRPRSPDRGDGDLGLRAAEPYLVSRGVAVGIGGQDRGVAAFRRRGRHGHEFGAAARRDVIRGRVGVELRCQGERCCAVREPQRGELRRGQRLAAVHQVPDLRRQRGAAEVGVALADAGPDGRAVERKRVGPDADAVTVEIAGLDHVFERQRPVPGHASVAKGPGGGTDVHFEAGRAAARVHVHVPVKRHRDGDGLAARVGVRRVQRRRRERDSAALDARHVAHDGHGKLSRRQRARAVPGAVARVREGLRGFLRGDLRGRRHGHRLRIVPVVRRERQALRLDGQAVPGARDGHVDCPGRPLAELQRVAGGPPLGHRQRGCREQVAVLCRLLLDQHRQVDRRRRIVPAARGPVTQPEFPVLRHAVVARGHDDILRLVPVVRREGQRHARAGQVGGANPQRRAVAHRDLHRHVARRLEVESDRVRTVRSTLLDVQAGRVEDDRRRNRVGHLHRHARGAPRVAAPARGVGQGLRIVGGVQVRRGLDRHRHGRVPGVRLELDGVRRDREVCVGRAGKLQRHLLRGQCRERDGVGVAAVFGHLHGGPGKQDRGRVVVRYVDRQLGGDRSVAPAARGVRQTGGVGRGVGVVDRAHAHGLRLVPVRRRERELARAERQPGIPAGGDRDAHVGARPGRQRQRVAVARAFGDFEGRC